jgi:hypothetical protein
MSLIVFDFAPTKTMATAVPEADHWEFWKADFGTYAPPTPSLEGGIDPYFQVASPSLPELLDRSTTGWSSRIGITHLLPA